jgi:hypothetical protein
VQGDKLTDKCKVLGGRQPVSSPVRQWNKISRLYQDLEWTVRRSICAWAIDKLVAVLIGKID